MTRFTPPKTEHPEGRTTIRVEGTLFVTFSMRSNTQTKLEIREAFQKVLEPLHASGFFSYMYRFTREEEEIQAGAILTWKSDSDNEEAVFTYMENVLEQLEPTVQIRQRKAVHWQGKTVSR